MAKLWVKFYTEVLEDREWCSLSWEVRGLWACILALAGRIDDRQGDQETGRVDTLEGIAWHLRAEVEFVERCLLALQQVGMVHWDQDQVLVLTHYAERQARSPSHGRTATRERVAAYRERQREEPGRPGAPGGGKRVTLLHAEGNSVTGLLPGAGDKSVTPLEQNRIEQNRKEERRAEEAAAPAGAPAGPAERETLPGGAVLRATEIPPILDAVRLFMDANGGSVSPLDIDRIKALIGEVAAWAGTSEGLDGAAARVKAEQVVANAVIEANACKRDNRVRIRFLEAILDRWQREGLPVEIGYKGNNGRGSSAGAAGLEIVVCPECNSRPCRCDGRPEREEDPQEALNARWRQVEPAIKAINLGHMFRKHEVVGIEDGLLLVKVLDDSSAEWFARRESLRDRAASAGVKVVLPAKLARLQEAGAEEGETAAV